MEREERQQTEKVATVNRIENQIYIMADENLSESRKGYLLCGRTGETG